MPHNASLDDLCKRLLAPFLAVLQEVERLSNATVAEERATAPHQPEPDEPAAFERMAAESAPKVAAVRGAAALPPSRVALPLHPAPNDNSALVPAVERQSAVTMPPITAGMPQHEDSLTVLPQAERETGQPPSKRVTIQSVHPVLPTAGGMLAQTSAPKADASIKPDDSVASLLSAAAVSEPSRYHGRPAIRLAPRASAVRSSRSMTMPSSATTVAPTPGSAGVPAGLPQNHPATGEQQALPVSAPHLPPSSTVPTTAPVHRQGIPLIPRPVQQTAARLVNGVEPVLERAYRLTQAALNMPAPEPLATQEKPIGQVHNTFNVAVSLNPSETTASLDREALQEALVELLRTAARRQGLEV